MILNSILSASARAGGVLLGALERGDERGDGKEDERKEEGGRKKASSASVASRNFCEKIPPKRKLRSMGSNYHS